MATNCMNCGINRNFIYKYPIDDAEEIWNQLVNEGEKVITNTTIAIPFFNPSVLAALTNNDKDKKHYMLHSIYLPNSNLSINSDDKFWEGQHSYNAITIEN